MAVQYVEFIEIVREHAGVDAGGAERAARASLQTLGERLSDGEAAGVAGRLPQELGPLVAGGAPGGAFGVEEFLRRVGEREGVEAPTAEEHARAVFVALARTLGGDEMRQVTAELPDEYDALLGPDASRSRGVPPPPLASVVRAVAQLGGMEEDRARRATDAVLEALALRIAGGQVDDIAESLPRELHEPLERGKRQSGGNAQRIHLDQFLDAIGQREGVSADAARMHARAVFTVLRELVRPKEFDDMVAQLPIEYEPLLRPPE
jgi:uncharacterized protein (DUF2267 family)